jgi:hypothetical protein
MPVEPRVETTLRLATSAVDAALAGAGLLAIDIMQSI